MTVRRPCPHPECIACREGRQDFCFTGDFTERGIKQQHGFMTEFVIEEEPYLNRVPRELRDVGVLAEPLTIAEKSLEQLWLIQQRLPWACPVQLAPTVIAPLCSARVPWDSSERWLCASRASR
jgi:hypothetical protein